MTLFKRPRLLARPAGQNLGVETVGRSELVIIETVGSEDAVLFRKPVIHADGREILIGRLLAGELVYAGVAGAEQSGVGKRIEDQVTRGGRVHRNRAGGKHTITRGGGRHSDEVG